MEGGGQVRGVKVDLERRNVCVHRVHGRPAVSHHLAGANCSVIVSCTLSLLGKMPNMRVGKHKVGRDTNERSEQNESPKNGNENEKRK